MKQLVIPLGMGLATLAFARWIGSDGAQWAGLPIVFVCAILAFGINWLAFIPAALFRTEHFYDLIGANTYGAVTVAALALSGRLQEPLSVPVLIVAGMVLIWCIRLGSMLFARVHRQGGDSRFDKIKTDPARFFGAWTLQAVWVVITLASALVVFTSNKPLEFGALFFVGLAIWTIGFAVEAIADHQKNAFRADPGNRGRFITTGLWSWSQHPNYFGEILLWAGIAVIAIPLLQGPAWAALVSPVFVFFLLTKGSGIPLLDKAAKAKWGDDPAYQDYIRRTSKLVPMPPRK